MTASEVGEGAGDDQFLGPRSSAVKPLATPARGPESWPNLETPERCRDSALRRR
jgi:hypothetical protein